MSATINESDTAGGRNAAHELAADHADGGWVGFMEAARTMCELSGTGLCVVHLNEMPPRAVVVVESTPTVPEHARDGADLSSPDAPSAADIATALEGNAARWLALRWNEDRAVFIGAQPKVRGWASRELARYRDLARTEAVLEALGEGVIVVDGDRRIAHVTQRAADLLGVDEPRAIEGRFARAVLPQAVDELEPNEVARGTVGPDTKVTYVAHHLAPRLGETEPPPGLVLRLRSEARFSATRRGQMQLLSALRHDVRSPLTALRGLVGVLQEEPDMPRDERLSLLELLRQEAERTVTWVEDYLILLRLRFEPRAVNPVEMPAEQPLRTLERELGPHAKERNVTFSIESQLGRGSGARLLADPSLIDVFCKNLLGHFMRLADSGATVRVRLAPDGALIVEGFGPGLFAQHPNNPFTTLARSTAAGKRTPGVGLGLFLAKKVADVHGWPIAIEVVEGVVRATVKWI